MDRLGEPVPPGSPSPDGAGRSLPPALLLSCLLATIFSTVYSLFTINAQLRNYRKPILQRHVVRLLLMVPLYSISSLISLFSLQAAFLIDLIRDLYEAFVIYSFFTLLVEYLGGERSILILLHGRDPINHLFPFNYFLGKIDPSDPYTLLAIKRGVLQYVQFKPVLAGITVLLKAMGKYQDGKFAWNNGYTYVSTLYNISVFVSLYALALLWSCLSADLQSFRVTTKFLCIKGIIFFSFWQSLVFSFLVSPLRWITSLGPIDDPDFISLALQDASICFEMIGFAIWHNHAFSWTDYKEKFGGKYQARLPAMFAIRDVIGLKDVWYDSITTIKGQGYDYRLFEPSEGLIHADLARKKRFKAGLRYSKGGQSKYWLPQRTFSSSKLTANSSFLRPKGPISIIKKYINDQRIANSGYAPLLKDEINDIVHLDPELIEQERERRRRKFEQERNEAEQGIDSESGIVDPIPSSSAPVRKDYGSTSTSNGDVAHHPQNGDQEDQVEGLVENHDDWENPTSISAKIITSARSALKFWPGSTEYLTDEILEADSPAELSFSDPWSEQMNARITDGNHDEELTTEELYDLARKLEYGDYNYPNVDLNREEGRRAEWIKDEEVINKFKNKKKEMRKSESLSKSDSKSKGKEEKKKDGKGKGKGKGKERMLEEGQLESDEHQDDPVGNSGRRARRGWNTWADEEDEGLEETQRDSKSSPQDQSSQSGSSKQTSTSSPNGKKEDASKQSKAAATTSPNASPAPGARDLVVEDFEAEERERILERRRGDPAMRAGKATRIFRRIWNEEEQKEEEVEVGQDEIEKDEFRKRGEKAAKISNSTLPIEIESEGHSKINHHSEGSPQETFDRNKESQGQKEYIDAAHERIKLDLEEVDRERQEEQAEEEKENEVGKEDKEDKSGDEKKEENDSSSNHHHHHHQGKIETAEVGKERKVAKEIDVDEAMKDFQT